MLLPFFEFNYYFVDEGPLLTHWIALDFGASAVMLAVSLRGWREKLVSGAKSV